MTGSVLIFLETFLPASQAFVAQQARALTRYEPRFLVSKRVSSPLENLDGFRVQEMRATAAGFGAELALKLPRVGLPALIPSVRECSLIHAHFGKNGFVIEPMARAAGKPLLITFHGFDATFRGDPNGPGGFNQARFFRSGRAALARDRGVSFIAVSEFIRRRLIDLEFPAERVTRHYIGVDTSFFSPNPSIARIAGRVVCISRFVEYKGHRYLIDALAKAQANGTVIDFVMVGDGPLREDMEALARERLNTVTLHRKLSQGAIRDLLASAELYLHGSVTLDNGHAEAMGIAILEAQAMGTPVIAFDSGGVGEALRDGETGFICVERDTEGMALAIARLLADSQLRARLGEAAIAFVRGEFDIRRQTGALESIYDNVIADTRRKEPA